jgi:ABC-type antimicrobial peptide transport system permease subunit
MSSEGGMDRAFSRLTSMMFNSLGPAFPATASLPLLETMRSSLTMRFFLEAIFLAVIFMVLLIASITVYSLFNIDTETNTYTYAMLRALGLTRPQLATMLVLKALTIGILGTAVGLTVATFAIMFVDELLRRSTNAAATDIFTSASLGVSIAVGIALPLGATILPIGRAMSTVLVNALTASRSAANQAVSTIQKLSKLDMQPYQVTAALLLIVFGVFTAYLMPMALLNEDMQLFLGLLVTVLMCTLVGLSLLSQSIMPRLHTAMGWIFTVRQNASR